MKKYLLLVVALVALAACGPKGQVRLDYLPVALQGVSCSGPVAVVGFADARENQAVAEDRKGRKLFPAENVAVWAGRALTDQLSQAGCRAEYHDKAYDFGATPVVAGEVQQAYVRQTGMTTYVADIKLKLKIRRAGQPDLTRDYVGSLERTVVIKDSETYTELLREGLQDVLREAVPALVKDIR